MTTAAPPKLALRPMLPTDPPLLAEIFRAAIEELTGEGLQRGAAGSVGRSGRRRGGIRCKTCR